MTFLQTVRNVLAPPYMPPPMPSKAATGTSSFSGILGNMTRFGSASTMDSMNTEAAYILAMTSAWVYSDIKLISDRAASANAAIEVYRGEDEDKEHPFIMLMERPNSLMSGSFMRRYLAQWYLLRGNAFAFVSTPSLGRGEPTELWPLEANKMTPLPESLRNGQGFFRGQPVIDYEYNVGGSIEKLPGENVIHFRTPNPFDYWNGLSPLTAALLGIQHDYAQQKWQRDFFAEDNAIPSAIISVPATTSPVDFDRQRAILSQQMSEGQKRLFTRSGDLTVETITQTLEQMQIIESRNFNRDEIDRIYGVPEGLISGGLSGDSRLAAEIAFARNTIQPLLDYMAEQFTADLAPFYGGEVVFRAPNVIPQDRALEVQEYSIYSQDRSVDENRGELGLEPANLPPELKELATIPVRLLNMVRVAQEPPTDPQQEGQEAQEEPQQAGDMIGSQSPENVVDEQAGKAIQLAIDTELKQWRKVAVKEYKDGRNPAERQFDCVAIDDTHKASILAALTVAEDESEVKAAFESATFRHSDWQDYP